MVGMGRHSGFRDWIAQRVSAILIGAYTIFIAVYFMTNQPLYFAQWSSLFSNIWMKMATFIVLLSILWHAWIGLWTVFTDYVKPTAVRLVLQIIVILLLAAYLLWGFEILWVAKIGAMV